MSVDEEDAEFSVINVVRAIMALYREASSVPAAPVVSTPSAAVPDSDALFLFPDFEVDGFRLVADTDFGDEEGDAFVIAPDGSRAELIWEVSSEGCFEQVGPFEGNRWGTWAVAFPFPMRTEDDARRALQAILPKLKDQWEVWRRMQAERSGWLKKLLPKLKDQWEVWRQRFRTPEQGPR